MNTLPPELLQRVASFSSCESVLALTRVNRHFYDTCYDKAVFRAVIENGNGLGGEQWNCGFIADIASVSDLARLALADLKARTWVESLKTPKIEEDQNVNDPMLSWVPDLMALNHPFLAQTDTFKEIVNKCLESADLALGKSVLFHSCVTSAALYNRKTAVEIAEDPEFFIRRQVVAHFPHNLLSPAAVACSLLLSAQQLLDSEVALPSPDKIPFRDIFGVPVPFSSTMSSSSHLSVMTSPSFLQNGEWVGYYNYTMDLADYMRNQWDPPMTGIRFTANPDDGVFAVTASGVDSVAGFTLTGSVEPNGDVQMRKDYGMFHWDWHGSMTPFGIVGTWGQRHTPRGYFWLWKREWC